MTRTVMVIAIGIATGLAGLAAPASAQDIKRGPNGTLEVHFSGPCTVGYDPSGSRIFADRSCSGSQVRTADMMMRGRVQQQPGYGNPGYGYPGSGNGWGGQPIVNVNNNGWGTVNFRNGCVVTFNRDGNRVGDTRPCNSRMRAEATSLYQQRLWGGGGRYPSRNDRDYGYGYGAPRIDLWGNLIRVQMQGTNCTYTYNRSGNHVASSGSQCDSRLRDRANDAVRDYRRRMNW